MKIMADRRARKEEEGGRARGEPNSANYDGWEKRVKKDERSIAKARGVQLKDRRPVSPGFYTMPGKGYPEARKPKGETEFLGRREGLIGRSRLRMRNQKT